MKPHTSPESRSLSADGWYEQIRRLAPGHGQSSNAVHENTDADGVFQWDERFLQALWNEQRFGPELHMADGRRLEVVSPGTWNVEAGPDFQNALLRIDGLLSAGDVEIHRTVQDWVRHGHDRDPAYAKVILHAVWRAPVGSVPPGLPPCFILRPHLAQPWEDLLDEISAEVYPYARQVGSGDCAVYWAAVENNGVSRFFRAAGLARFSDKSRRLQREGIRKGFDQTLYENVFEALGYKSNRVPFRTLAQALPLSYLESVGSGEELEACLFGAAGLLPDPTAQRVHRELVPLAHRLWDLWWSQGRQPFTLPWQRAGVRPLNSPERRLAAGVALLQRWGFHPARHLLGVFESGGDASDLLRRLRSEFRAEGLWCGFGNFAHRLRKPAGLVGSGRVHDILANVVFPFGAALGRQQDRPEIEELAREAWLLLPALQENRVLIEAAHRLLSPPSRAKELIGHASEQQGLLQVYQDFCLTLHNDCLNCPLRTGIPVEESLPGVKVRGV